MNTSDLISNYSTASDEKHHLQDHFRIRSFSYALKKIINALNINSEDKNINLIDIGCASGAFLYAATKLTNWNVHGVEPSLKLVEFGKKEYDVHIKQGVFKVEEYSDTKIDIISLWDVLEHVNEPELLIEEVSKTLVNGGYLIINVPNLDSIFARLLGYSWPFYLAVHIHYFKNQTIQKLLKKQNFEICYERAYFQQLGLGYILYRMSNSVTQKFKYNRIFQFLDIIPAWYNMGQTTFVAKKCL
jgi:2-polyprenyl-3-methyl-5-hydroxy-6-metoxy-1,4-benzoquinol methylase